MLFIQELLTEFLRHNWFSSNTFVDLLTQHSSQVGPSQDFTKVHSKLFDQCPTGTHSGTQDLLSDGFRLSLPLAAQWQSTFDRHRVFEVKGHSLSIKCHYFHMSSIELPSALNLSDRILFN